MKRLLTFFLCCTFLCCTFGCNKRVKEDITREDVIVAYEEAGYVVSSRVYDEKLEHGQIGYVQADHPDGDYIYFAIFENEEDAKAYKKELYHPGMIALFSAFFGDPSWERMKVYGCIVVSYDNPNLFGPFEKLLKD